MKNSLAVIILISCAVLLINCKKKAKDLTAITLDTDSIVHARFNYAPGSYWIYRDSLNGRMDSVYVRNNYLYKQAEANAVFTYHYITLAEVNIDGKHKSDSANWVFNFQGNKIIVDYYYGLNGYGWKNDITYSPLFLYPFQYGDNTSSFDTATVKAIYDSILIRNVAYYNVADIKQFIRIPVSSKGLGLTYIDDEFYVSDSVGMVQMRLYHPYDSINHLWELVRYKVTKY